MAYFCPRDIATLLTINQVITMRKLYALMLSLQILLVSAIGLSGELAAQERPTDANIIGHVTDAKTG